MLNFYFYSISVFNVVIYFWFIILNSIKTFEVLKNWIQHLIITVFCCAGYFFKIAEPIFIEYFKNNFAKNRLWSIRNFICIDIMKSEVPTSNTLVARFLNLKSTEAFSSCCIKANIIKNLLICWALLKYRRQEKIYI